MGFPTRKDAIKTEEKGLNILEGKMVKIYSKMFYTGMLAYNPFINEDEALKLMDKYSEEGGDVDEVVTFLTGEYQNFLKPQESKKKTKKKAQIITE